MSSAPEPLADWVVRIAAVQALIVVLIFLGVMVLHAVKMRNLRRRKQFYDTWRPLLVQSLVEAPATVPPVRRKEIKNFLYYWNYFHQSLLGEEKMAGLNQVARITGMDVVARRLLRGRNVQDKLLAIATLGRLRDPSLWDEFVRLAETAHPTVSLAAARALLQLDPKAAMVHVSGWVGVRDDWSPAKVTSMLNEAGAELVAKPLAEAAEAAPPDKAVRLIHHLKETRSVEALPAVRRLLDGTADEAVRAACVNLIGQFADPRDLPAIRQAVVHPSAAVRSEAAAALGRMGVKADEDTLISLLTDPDWDVRYRAAEALATLPFVDDARLKDIHAEVNLPEGQAMLAACLERRRILA